VATALLEAQYSARTAAPLPRITGLTPEARLRLEFDMVDRSITYARDQPGLVYQASPKPMQLE